MSNQSQDAKTVEITIFNCSLCGKNGYDQSDYPHDCLPKASIAIELGRIPMDADLRESVDKDGDNGFACWEAENGEYMVCLSNEGALSVTLRFDEEDVVYAVGAIELLVTLKPGLLSTFSDITSNCACDPEASCDFCKKEEEILPSQIPPDEWKALKNFVVAKML